MQYSDAILAATGSAEDGNHKENSAQDGPVCDRSFKLNIVKLSHG